MHLDLPETIAEIEKLLPLNWTWLIRFDPDKRQYFANIYNIKQPINTHRTFHTYANTPGAALRISYKKYKETRITP